MAITPSKIFGKKWKKLLQILSAPSIEPPIDMYIISMGSIRDGEYEARRRGIPKDRYIILQGLEPRQEVRPKLCGIKVLNENALIGEFTRFERWLVYGRYKGENWPAS